MRLRRRHSLLLSLFFGMMGFGVLIGLIFPFVVSPFVVWKDGAKQVFFVLCVVAGFLVGGGSFYLVDLFLLRKLRALSRDFKSLAEGTGQITSHIDFVSEDQIGELIDNFNLLLGRLRKFVERIRGVEQAISVHFNRTSAATQNLASSAESKTQIVVTTALSIEELDNNFEQIAKNLQELRQSADESIAAVRDQMKSTGLVTEQVGLLHDQCRINSESLNAATAAIGRTTSHLGELSTTLSVDASSMTQIDASIREINLSLKASSFTSEKVSQDAALGQQAVEKTREGIAKIHQSFESLSAITRSFAEKVKEIAAITDVIHEVNDQTSLLALNATIIAAQAGEHGRGFAVVAGQMKNLSSTTLSSTDKIGGLVRTFQDQAMEAIRSITQSREFVAEGRALSQQAGDALARIQGSASDSHQQIRSIEIALQEIAATTHSLTEKTETIAERAKEISSANMEQASKLGMVSQTVQETQDVASVLAESARKHLDSSRRIQSQTEKVHFLIEQIRAAIQMSGEETHHQVESIQQLQRLSVVEKEAVVRLESESKWLEQQCQALKEEIALMNTLQE